MKQYLMKRLPYVMDTLWINPYVSKSLCILCPMKSEPYGIMRKPYERIPYESLSSPGAENHCILSSGPVIKITPLFPLNQGK